MAKKQYCLGVGPLDGQISICAKLKDGSAGTVVQDIDIVTFIDILHKTMVARQGKAKDGRYVLTVTHKVSKLLKYQVDLHNTDDSDEIIVMS